jgi:hypothetical protein
MNDRLGDEQLGARLGARIARQATSISPRLDDDALFARVGARAARQRRLLSIVAVVAVTVASFTGYVFGTTNRDGDSIVQTPVAGPTDPVTSAPPAPGDAAYDGPLERVFTRTTANGITVRVFTSPRTEDPSAPGLVVAEMSNDAAVGVGRAEHCLGGDGRVSGTFGGPEGFPAVWIVLQIPDVPSAAGVPVRATLDGVTDEMVPVGGIAVLALPGAGPGVLIEGFGGGGLVTVGETLGCTPPTPPATLPPPGPQPADVEAAEAGVRQAYVEVYDDYEPAETDPKVRRALEDAGFTDEQLVAMTVEVGEVRFTDETHAAVLFRTTIPGHSDGSQEWRLGYAVLQDGRWTQAPETTCEDLRSVGADCPEP